MRSRKLIGQIEGILHIAGGVILGHVQAGKVVVIVLDLREGAHRKAHAGEHVDDLVGDQGQRCRPPMGRVLAGRVISTVSAALRAASSACFTVSAAAS